MIGWHASECKDNLHVVPVNDWIEHDTSGTDCICGPKITIVEIGAPLVVTHNSLDGRELSEPDYEATA